ncbi:uncharacterized protein LOC119371831 [Rhipicephalus sanguineus]|uniref:uncharacterized protein LOC119371831 n=1 Tax=Rhipicephalus sanguineus TaxID=34632 RepID=UPI00189537A5|nr:uncharacterized protein LOC119371831 [Rhipicephalus sanguineus]
MATSLGWTLLLAVSAACVSCSCGVDIPWRWQGSSAGRRAPREQNRCLSDANALEIGDRSTCPFDVIVNVDPKRIPAEIPMASCRCPKFQCGPNKRCVTLSYAIDVLYNVSGVLKLKKIDTSSGCVCASPQLVSADNTTVAGRAPRVDNPGYYLMR